jgi:hypothetical protein
MSKMKRYFPIFIVLLAIIGIIVGVVLSNGQRSQLPVQPAPTPVPRIGFKGIDVNTATTGGVISALGNPARTDRGQNQTTLIYASGVGNQPIDVNADANNKVSSIVVPAAQGTKLSVLSATLGKEDVVLYGTGYYSGYYLYTYLSQGTAILANPQTDDVKEQIYFPLSDLSTFLQTAGVGFQTSPLSSGQE